MKKGLTILLVVAVIGVFVLFNAVFIVGQTEQALVLQLGKPVRVEQKPGLKFKTPFVQNVEFFSRQLLDFEGEPKEVIAADQKRLIVDAFVRYRITDPLRFKQTVSDERTMKSRLNSILESNLRQVLGSEPLSALISEKRSAIMAHIRDRVNAQASSAKVEGDDSVRGFGIEIVDVRIKRADLPQANSEGIYKRMQTERQREAAEFRARGAEDAQKIRSQADKERTIILAEAKKTAETTRGQGDGEATKIFAQSFGQDQDFFAFYRTLQAYKKTLNSKDTTLILSPDSEFLKTLDKGDH